MRSWKETRKIQQASIQEAGVQEAAIQVKQGS
jgi:hypothetical protein